MSRKPNPRLIGAFLVGALILLIVAVAIVGSGKLFRKSRTFVVYFDSNVSGLDVGAPVSFRGVRVGTVSEVVLIVNPKTYDINIKVLVDIEQDRMQDSLAEFSAEKSTALYRILLDRGLRAQLKTTSLVTGQQYVGLDFFPEIPAVFLETDPDILEIPAVPTSSEQLQRSLAEVIENLKAADIKQVVANVQSVLASLDRLLSSGDLHDSIAKLNVALGEIDSISKTLGGRMGEITTELVTTLDDIQLLVTNLNDTITTISADMRILTADARATLQSANSTIQLKEGVPAELARNIMETSSQTRQTLESLDATLIELRGTIAADSPVMNRLDETLRELAPMLRAIRHLTETLEQNPQAILYGNYNNE